MTRPIVGRGTYGWRARVGMITVASTIETPLYELYRMAPDGVTFVAMGLNIRRVTPEAVADAWKNVAEASREAAAYYLDHLIVSGAPLAYHGRRGDDRELINLVEAACGVPTTFELTASVEALRRMDVERVAIGTPFGATSNRRIQKFFEGEGFVVTAIEGLGYEANPDITRLPVEATYEVSRTAWQRDRSAQAIYITCPRWPVAPVIEPLEQDLGVPVVASMQSALWSALQRLDLHAPVKGFGRLLSHHLA